MKLFSGVNEQGSQRVSARSLKDGFGRSFGCKVKTRRLRRGHPHQNRFCQPIQPMKMLLKVRSVFISRLKVTYFVFSYIIKITFFQALIQIISTIKDNKSKCNGEMSNLCNRIQLEIRGWRPQLMLICDTRKEVKP